jgi:predicted amidophosphoribosyltransferase
VSATAPLPAPASTDGAVERELCPLCGSPLKREQDWCMRCGAAARTRLAAQPKWKALVIGLAVVVVLALGVLTAALVTLAG